MTTCWTGTPAAVSMSQISSRVKSQRALSLRRPRRGKLQLCNVLASEPPAHTVGLDWRPKKDMSADLLGRAVKLALKSRLTSNKRIDVDINCDVSGLIGGKLGGMQITGKRWITPLNLTAETLEVSLSNMHIDYWAFVWQQRLTLCNTPTGITRFVLNSADLGNFMVHPIMKKAAATAVMGMPFEFDKNAVSIEDDLVRYQGYWQGEQYQVSMQPLPGSQLRLTAQPVQGGSTEGACIVAGGLARFFSQMEMDLQGIELRFPALSILPSKGSSADHMLEIAMRMKLRNFPPLDMQF